MILTIILVLVAIFAGIFFFIAARGSAASVADVAALEGRTQPVDFVAFQNLTDPAEEEFLRDNLPARDFRRVQRERLRATMAYVNAVAGNAAVLLRLGEAARRSPNPEIAEAGLQLVNHALKVRLYAFSARIQFGMALLWPGIHISPGAVSELYQELTGTVSRLGHLQNSTPARRLAAIL
jgi:hypothetical protein